MAAYVLVIDDDDDMRELMSHAAGVLGLPVLRARDGREALAHIQRRAPALILLDLCMPDMTGWAMLDQIRDNPDIEAVPVLVLTTMPTSRRLAASLRLPVRYVLQKHQPIANLQKLIRDLVTDDIA